MNIKIGKGGSGKISSTKGGSGKINQRKYIDLLPSPSNLTFLFDPIFYKSEIQNEILGNQYGYELDPAFLEQIRNYQIEGAVPNIINNPTSRQWIVGAPQNTKKAEIKNNTFSYIKYKDATFIGRISLSGGTYGNGLYTRLDPDSNIFSYNGPNDWYIEISSGGIYYILNMPDVFGAASVYYSQDGGINWLPEGGVEDPGTPPTGVIENATGDVEQRKLNRWYQSIVYTKNNYGVSPPTDNRFPLLKLSRNDNGSIFSVGSEVYSTLNIFIRLQRPVSHKNPNSGYIVREKKGIFCTSSPGSGQQPFSIGYRSPYYNISNQPSYKGVFNNFSFVFSFGQRGYDLDFARPISSNFMTDYKFNFGEMYMLTLVSYNNYLNIYINGEQQSLAKVPHNPLINPSFRFRGIYQVTLSGGSYNNGTYSGGNGDTILNGPNGKYIELLNAGPLKTYGLYPGDLYSFDPAHPDFPSPLYSSTDGGITWQIDGSSSAPGTPPNGAIDSTLGRDKNLYADRKFQVPLGPGFRMANGSLYPWIDAEWGINPLDPINISNLIFGKSSLAYGMQNYINSRKKRRYLNNLDIGVINSYNVALSQNEISQIYNNFRYRYI